MTDSNNSLSLKNSKNKLHLILLFAGVALLIVFLHFRTEGNLRGEIPPHSDSLVIKIRRSLISIIGKKGNFPGANFFFQMERRQMGGRQNSLLYHHFTNGACN